jgi:hypothetical protein
MRIRSTLARFAACTVLGWIALGGVSAVASAHAEFESTSVTATSTTQVVLDVPHERAPNVFNTAVRIQIPSGWSAPTCTSPAGWICSISSGEVAFSKNDPRSIINSSEAFRFALSAPASTGTTTFPVVQIYDTGENVLWSSSAQLQVAPAQTPTTSIPQPSPSPSPTTPKSPPTTTAQSESSNAGSGTDGGSSASTALGPDSSNAVTLQADQTDDSAGAQSESTSDGAPIATIVVAVIVVIIVGGAAFAPARRRGR